MKAEISQQEWNKWTGQVSIRFDYKTNLNKIKQPEHNIQWNTKKITSLLWKKKYFLGRNHSRTTFQIPSYKPNVWRSLAKPNRFWQEIVTGHWSYYIKAKGDHNTKYVRSVTLVKARLGTVVFFFVTPCSLRLLTNVSPKF
jgi:hypothetical protein